MDNETCQSTGQGASPTDAKSGIGYHITVVSIYPCHAFSLVPHISSRQLYGNGRHELSADVKRRQELQGPEHERQFQDMGTIVGEDRE